MANGEPQQDITLSKLQLLACSSTAAEFNGLLKKYAESQSPELDEEGNEMTGRQYMKRAIEKSGITEPQEDGSTKFTKVDVKEKEEKQEAVDAYKTPIEKLRQEFADAVWGLKEIIVDQGRELQTQGEQIGALRAELNKLQTPSL